MARELPRRRRFARHALALLALTLAIACRAAPVATREAGAPEISAGDDAPLRHLRVRIAPAQTKDFEALLERCVASAEDASLAPEAGWLVYREPPGRYQLVWFGAPPEAGSVPPESALVTFLRTFTGRSAADRVAELGRIEWELEWSLLLAQRAAWTSPVALDPARHPKLRLMGRQVRPGREDAFAEALAARTGFLVAHGYPLPVEGFESLEGPAGFEVQAVFATDWPRFHGRDSFKAFLERLSEAERTEYARVKAALMATMASADYFDADLQPALSFPPGTSDARDP